MGLHQRFLRAPYPSKSTPMKRSREIRRSRDWTEALTSRDRDVKNYGSRPRRPRPIPCPKLCRIFLVFFVNSDDFHESNANCVEMFFAVPLWAALTIASVALLLLLCCCCCLCKLCFKRRKDKGFRKGLKSAVDLKSVQVLGSTLKEKVNVTGVTRNLQVLQVTSLDHVPRNV